MAPTALTFRSTAPLNELQEVRVNGMTVDPSNYTTKEGSTIVTLPIEYLKTLDADNYEIAVVSDSKSAKCGFSVVEPDLNEHGFYYNQPYTAYVGVFGSKVAFFIREDGTLDAIVLKDGSTETCPYTISGADITVTSASMGVLNCTVSSNGTEIYNTQLALAFKLGDESIAADDDYTYTYDDSLGGYVVRCIDKTQASYGAIKTGIDGLPTVKLGDRMFESNANMTIAPKIPTSVTTIGDDAFAYCTNLVSCSIHDGLINIGERTFNGCSKLTNITIPAVVTTIRSTTFENCKDLISVTFGTNSQLTAIESYAFSGCDSLTDIIIPDNVITIGDSAFLNCTSMTSIHIPDSVTNIGSGAFYNCHSLTDIYIDDVAAWLNISHDGFYALPTVVNTLEKRLYVNGELLTGLVIPEGITNIGQDAFYKCSSIVAVTIPNSVLSIGEIAFRYCASLNTMVFEGTVEQWNGITKGDLWNDCVPATYVQCSDGTVSLV